MLKLRVADDWKMLANMLLSTHTYRNSVSRCVAICGDDVKRVYAAALWLYPGTAAPMQMEGVGTWTLPQQAACAMDPHVHAQERPGEYIKL